MCERKGAGMRRFGPRIQEPYTFDNSARMLLKLKAQQIGNKAQAYVEHLGHTLASDPPPPAKMAVHGGTGCDVNHWTSMPGESGNMH